MKEAVVEQAVKTYFTDRFPQFSVSQQCEIQFGTRYGIADVVLHQETNNEQGRFVAIAECKTSPLLILRYRARAQLKSYLSATNTRFGVLAVGTDPRNWEFCENRYNNWFTEIAQETFEKGIENWEPVLAAALAVDGQGAQGTARWWKWLSLVLGVMFVVTCTLLLVLWTKSPSSTNGFVNRDNLHQVVRVIDGDTVELEYEGALTSVQLIGVNAPETVHPGKPVEPYGKEATAFLQKLLLYKFVYFEFDRNKRDRYDRLLAYVYRDSDDLFVNVELIRQGYGKTDARFPFKYMKLFQYHESQARTARKRLWSR